MPNQIPLGFLTGAAAPFGGFTWVAENPTAIAYNGGVYANLTNGKFFGFGNNDGAQTTTYAYSTNGTSWSTGTLPSARDWGKAATNGTRIVATCTDDTDFAYSTNGTTWTAVSVITTTNDIIWDGTRFLAVGSSTTTNLAHSTDGISWAGIDIGSGFYSIGFDGTSRWIAGPIASTATARTATSNPTVAGNWGNLTMPSTGVWISFIYGNGTWLANTADSTTYATSTNGTTWTSRTLPGTFGNTDNSARPLFFDGFFWIMVTVGGNAVLYASADAITWTEVKNFGSIGTSGSPALQNISGWAATTGTIVGFGNFTQFNEVSVGDPAIIGTK